MTIVRTVMSGYDAADDLRAAQLRIIEREEAARAAAGRQSAGLLTDRPETTGTGEPVGAPAKQPEARNDNDKALDEALDFLGHWPTPFDTLMFIPIDPVSRKKIQDKIEVASFEKSDRDGKRRWIRERNGRGGLYFVPNVLREPVSKKPSKPDVQAVICLHIDMDVEPGQPVEQTVEAMAREVMGYRGGAVQPNVVVKSGGGVQAFWILSEPIVIEGDLAKAAEVERHTRALEDDFGADNCHNIDRVMRLPFTVNVVDEGKLAAGRKDALATIVHADFGHRHHIGAFDKAEPKATVDVTVDTSGPEGPLTPEEFDALPERVRVEGSKPVDRSIDRSPIQHGLTCEMVRAAVPDNVVWRALRDTARLPFLADSILFNKDGSRKSRSYAKKQIARAKQAVASEPPVPKRKHDDERIRVRVDLTHKTEMIEEVEHNLVAAGLPIYRNGPRIVEAVRFDVPKGGGADSRGRYDDGQGIRRAPGALLMRTLPKTRLLEHIDTTMAFYKPTPQGPRPVEAPGFLTDHIVNRTAVSNFQILTGIIETPTISEDGILIDRDGYDPRSGLILDLGGIVYPEIPQTPTFDQARAALDVLLEPLDEFPFVADDEDAEPSPLVPSAARSVALAAILTAVVRKSLGPCPLFGFSASTPGTGKSILADVVANIGTGRSSNALAVPPEEAEFEKRLNAAAISGAAMLTLDNVSRPLNGNFLCQLVEREQVEVRPMGQNASNLVIAPKMLTMATGNNLVFAADFSRRALLCSLDAREEHPERRNFKRRDLPGWVRANRPQLVAAALTVLMAHHAAGRPSVGSLTPFGSFESWSAWVRQALVWLGEPDPVATVDRIKAADPDRDGLATLLNAIAASDFGQPNDDGAFKVWSASQLLDALGAGTDAAKQLTIALAGINNRGSDEAPSAKSLGRYLIRHKDRPVDGLFIKAGKNPDTKVSVFSLRYKDRVPGEPKREEQDEAAQYVAHLAQRSML